MFRFAKSLGRDIPTAASALTVVLTNWKRPKNLRMLLDALSCQTVKPDIFLWNNGAEFSHPVVDWQVDSSVNMLCWPRWWMASCAQTEFTCIMDDDLMPTDGRLLQDMLKVLSKTSDATIVGLFGMNLLEGKEYRYCTQVRPSDADQPADIIKGRFMMMRTSALAAVPLQPRPERHSLMCEDIMVSGLLAKGMLARHLVPRGFVGRLKELSNEHSLYKMPDHFEHREKARKLFFSV